MADAGPPVTYTHADSPNPLVNNYLTSDGRYVTLMMLQLDKFFGEAMTAIGLAELVTDARFAEQLPRYENRVELVRLIDEAFAKRTLAEWREALAPPCPGGRGGAWCRPRRRCATTPTRWPTDMSPRPLR